MNINIQDVDAIIFDFDGVLTNNQVLLDENGKEWVSCNRGDGLAFDAFRKLGKKVYIVSTETNPVVSARAKKLRVPVLQGIGNKAATLSGLVEKERLDFNRILYVGNDLNDMRAMKLCGYSVCPADSHYQIKSVATGVLKKNGGDGVVREILEEIFKQDVLQILYPE